MAIALPGSLAAVASAEGAPEAHSTAARQFVDDKVDVSKLHVPRDTLLIVALGDGIASGEGNPDGGRWRVRRCHRSAVSGAERAAHLLAEVARTRPVTFVNLACSGATIPRGLRGSFAGMPAQIAMLRKLVAHHGRAADAVLLSAGAADVHFGAILRRCLGRSDCRDRQDRIARAALAALPARYEALAREMRRRAGPERIRPVRRSRVFFIGPFDPTRDARGAPCAAIAGASGPDDGGMSAREVLWAQDALLGPLDDAVAVAARRHGWTLVDGIGAAFAGHGACAGGARWVRTAREAALAGGVHGTLHPNDAGQAAIGGRVASVVGRALKITKEQEQAARGGETLERLPWPLYVLLGSVLLLAFGLFGPDVRTRVRLLGRRGPHLDAGDGDGPQGPRLKESWTTPVAGADRDIARFAVSAARWLGTAVLTTSFVAAVGAAIVWVRFWAARYPADQAVDVVGRGELLVVGAQALGLFAAVGVAAVFLLWVGDSTGRDSRRTRAALALLLVLELAAAVLLGEFDLGQREQMLAGLAVLAVALLVVVNALHRVRKDSRYENRFPGILLRFELARTFLFDVGDPQDTRPEVRNRLKIFQALPLLALAGALVAAASLDGAIARGICVAALLVLAGELYVLPFSALRGIRAPATQARAGEGHLSAVRAVLAVGVSLSFLILLWREERWLAVSAIAAFVLAGVCLAVANASGERFAPLAIAVVATVGVFGAITTCLRIVDSPKAQPVAMLLKGDQRAICGVWVGESDGRVWYARLPPSSLAAVRRPDRRGTMLQSMARDDILDLALGPLQEVDRAQAQAAALRRTLIAEHDVEDADPGGRCGPRHAPAQKVRHTPERWLARSLQPELIVDRREGFWPVSAMTLFHMQDRRRHLCRRVADHRCVRVTSPSDLPFSGGEGEWLDMPAALTQVNDQRRLFYDAVGSMDPAVSQRMYFLVTRGRGPRAPYTVQFWFFYTYNYLDAAGHFPSGLHEGDFETVAMLVSARSHQPRYVWMARHSEEGRMFVWDEDRLKKTRDGRLIAYAARGSHATYETCTKQSRPLDAPFGLIDDRPQCDPDQELHLTSEGTHLIDLSRVPWACWHGYFGERSDDPFVRRTPYVIARGPLSPLWQQGYGGERVEPCRGVVASGSREIDQDGKPGEEVLGDAVSAQLRAGAARLDGAVDDCSDWEHPPATGVFLMACDQAQLSRYVHNGLEPPSSGGLRIDVASDRGVQAGPVTVPAVRRDPGVTHMGHWWITSGHTTRADIYASCQTDGGMLEGTFPNVRITPRTGLRLLTSGARWSLVDARGHVRESLKPTPTKDLPVTDPVCGKPVPCPPNPVPRALPPHRCAGPVHEQGRTRAVR